MDSDDEIEVLYDEGDNNAANEFTGDDEVEVLYDEGDDNNSADEFIGDDDISMEAVITSGQQNQVLGVEEGEDYSYEILSTEQIVQHMLDSVKEVNTVVEIPSTITRILLHHFKWDKQKLMERYYDGDQDKLFAEAHVVNPFKSSRNKEVVAPRNSNNARPSSSNEDCGICFVSAPISTMSGLKCGHRFCTDCWNDYLTTKISEGIVQTISCAAHNCDILVDDSSVMKLVKDPKIKLKYQQLITNSFVECNKLLRWCPTVDCNHAIKVQSVEAKAVTCKCNSTFCFGCGEAWHEPINCEMLRKWTKQCEEDSETSSWMAKNTKDCPKCNTNIEKNEGCNYVICTKCQQQFCWLCRHPTFNYSAHECIKFKVSEPSREVLQRYLFYNYRYMNHRKSLKFEDVLYAKVNEKMEEMQRQDMTWIEVQFLKKAVDVLRSCRQTLMYTYAFAFYLKKTNQTAIFEDNQKDLELSVETLSGFLERDIADENFTEIKQKVQDMLHYCESRRKVLLAHVHEGNDNDWWEFIKF